MKSGLREFASFQTELQIRDGAIHHVVLLKYGHQRSLTTQLLSQVLAGRLLQILQHHQMRRRSDWRQAQSTSGLRQSGGWPTRPQVPACSAPKLAEGIRRVKGFPDLRILHSLQALIYVVVIVPVRRAVHRDLELVFPS
jgi:hypothetical protein